MDNKLLNIIRTNYKNFWLWLWKKSFYIYTKYYLLKRAIDYILISKKQINILDVGGASGVDLKCISDYLISLNFNQSINYIVVDRNFDFYDQRLKHDFIRYINLDFISDSNKLKEDYWKFDIIISSEVIEHIWDIDKERFFVNFNNLLNTWWLLLTSIPNGSSILKNILMIHYKNNLSMTEDDFQNEYHHKWVPTIGESISLYNRKWFSIENILYTNFAFWLEDSFLWNLSRYLFYFPIIRYLFSTNIVYIWTKTEDINISKWYNAL